jgi:hypothetical protein
MVLVLANVKLDILDSIVRQCFNLQVAQLDSITNHV